MLHGFETFEISELSTLILGILQLNQNVWMLGKILMVENRNNMVIFSHHRQIQLFPAPPTPESESPQQLVRIPNKSSSRASAFRFCDSSGRFLPQSDSHHCVHNESENSPRVRNESGFSSRDGQPNRVDAPDHAVIPVEVEMQGEEFEVGANDKNPNFQRVPDHPFDENPHVEPQSPHSSQSRLPHPRITAQQFERNVREIVNIVLSSCSLG